MTGFFLLQHIDMAPERFSPVTELGKVLAFFRCSLRSNRPRRLSGLLGSSGVCGLEEGLMLPLPLLSVGLTSVTCSGELGPCERKHITKQTMAGIECGAHTLSLSLICLSVVLDSFWLRRSSRLCCCSLKPFCFCRASVIHKGPVSFSWTFELSSECLLCSEGFSAAGTHTRRHSIREKYYTQFLIFVVSAVLRNLVIGKLIIKNNK